MEDQIDIPKKMYGGVVLHANFETFTTSFDDDVFPTYAPYIVYVETFHQWVSDHHFWDHDFLVF